MRSRDKPARNKRKSQFCFTVYREVQYKELMNKRNRKGEKARRREGFSPLLLNGPFLVCKNTASQKKTHSLGAVQPQDTSTRWATVIIYHRMDAVFVPTAHPRPWRCSYSLQTPGSEPRAFWNTFSSTCTFTARCTAMQPLSEVELQHNKFDNHCHFYSFKKGKPFLAPQNTPDLPWKKKKRWFKWAERLKNQKKYSHWIAWVILKRRGLQQSNWNWIWHWQIPNLS